MYLGQRTGNHIHLLCVILNSGNVEHTSKPGVPLYQEGTPLVTEKIAKHIYIFSAVLTIVDKRKPTSHGVS